MTGEALWIPADWQVPDKVVAGCTTRNGGVSKGTFSSLNLGAHVGDREADVMENRRRFSEACGLPDEPLWLTQVHGTDVLVDPRRDAEADASFTASTGVVCVVMVADCLPVLFATDDGSELAAAHAGWRGLAGGVLENTVRAFDSAPESINAWLGPAISQPAFEVGDEVREAFVGHDDEAAACFARNAGGRWQADLYALARQRLRAAGITRISGGGSCTRGDADRFFSFRRDGQCGRMAAFVFRRP